MQLEYTVEADRPIVVPGGDEYRVGSFYVTGVGRVGYVLVRKEYDWFGVSQYGAYVEDGALIASMYAPCDLEAESAEEALRELETHYG